MYDVPKHPPFLTGLLRGLNEKKSLATLTVAGSQRSRSRTPHPRRPRTCRSKKSFNSCQIPDAVPAQPLAERVRAALRKNRNSFFPDRTPAQNTAVACVGLIRQFKRFCKF